MVTTYAKNTRLNFARGVVLLAGLGIAGCASVGAAIGDLYKGPYANYSSFNAPHNLLTKPVLAGELSSGFGWRFSPAGLPKPKKHKGIDYRAPAGTPVIAAGDGVVVEKRYSPSYGNIVVISHENGFSTAYAHLRNFETGLGKGQSVDQGQVIGYVGSTGRSTGPHLHYELRYRGEKIDPLFAN